MPPTRFLAAIIVLQLLLSGLIVALLVEQHGLRTDVQDLLAATPAGGDRMDTSMR